MNIVVQANHYMNIIMLSTVALFSIFGGTLYYLLKVKKITAMQEKISYDSFKRTSSLEYVKFDNIISDENASFLNGAGMVVVNEREFIAGIEVTGYNFAFASADEKQRTMRNAIAFVSIIEEPIQLRQTVEAVDIGTNIKAFEEARRKLIAKHEEYDYRYRELLKQAEAYENDPDSVETILKNMEALEPLMASTAWKIKEADAIVTYEKKLQERSANSKKISQVLFTYRYNPDEFSEELTKEEIYHRAMHALRTKASIYASTLGACGCSCRELSAQKLLNLMRKHMHPATADSVSLEELLDSSVTNLFITSDSLVELERERIEEGEFNTLMNQYLEEEQKEKDRAARKIDEELEAQMLKLAKADATILEAMQL